MNDAYTVSVRVEEDGSVSTNVVQHAPDTGANNMVTLDTAETLDISAAIAAS